MKAKFITFEGGEGTGKSTQIRMLADYLSSKQIDVLTTKEPGGTQIGSQIRHILVTERAEEMDPMSEVLLYYADRSHHVKYKILPALEQNKWVLSDRFADSTMAYQYYGYDKRVPKKVLENLYGLAVGQLKPDLTIILDLDVKIGLKRSFAKAEQMTEKETHFENIDVSFHENLRNGFLQIAKDNPQRCVVLDANTSVESLHEQIKDLVSKRFDI